MVSSSTGAEMREGDWTCPSCSNHNYASRLACNRCSTPKMMGGGCGGYGMSKAQANNARASPYGMPVAQPAGQGKAGDWTCQSCSNNNYAHRMVCNRCKMPRMGSVGMMQGPYGIMGMHPMMGMMGNRQMRPGDWMCRACNNHNFANREACNKCDIPKSVYIAKTGMREGDWLCPQCQNHNYASKTACNKCQRPKGNAPSHASASGTSKGMRAGDWICPQCSNHNYASKTNCNKCSVSKPW
eukprot:TRINITY_DN61431_c0_g1_i1.p1 TRINITY_DN61431_c0_g1~~TRINITY_DN61431_c0_g1_i1.p1  ORF type:complete len:241 (+),score=18.33 TRINITY_DN61431_c0_g1_i1:79-801(+)